MWENYYKLIEEYLNLMEEHSDATFNIQMKLVDIYGKECIILFGEFYYNKLLKALRKKKLYDIMFYNTKK